jgi:hypothetical protein
MSFNPVKINQNQQNYISQTFDQETVNKTNMFHLKLNLQEFYQHKKVEDINYSK